MINNFLPYHFFLMISLTLRMNSYLTTAFRWLHNLCTVPNYFSFFIFYYTFSLRSSHFSSSKLLNTPNSKRIRRVMLPFLYTQSQQKVLARSVEVKNRALAALRAVKHPSTQWKINFLMFLREYKLLGTIPTNTFRGDSTSVHPNYTSKLLHLKNYRRRLNFTLATSSSRTTRLALFRSYLQVRSDTTTSIKLKSTNLTTQLNSSIWLSNRRPVVSKLPRFRPYRYLNVEWPERSSEATPALYFKIFTKKQIFNTNFNANLMNPSLIPQPTLRADLYSVPKLQNFFSTFHRKLPRKLRLAFRWKHYSITLNTFKGTLKDHLRLNGLSKPQLNSSICLPSRRNQPSVLRKMIAPIPTLPTLKWTWISASRKPKNSIELNRKQFKCVRQRFFNINRIRLIRTIYLYQSPCSSTQKRKFTALKFQSKLAPRLLHLREDLFFIRWANSSNCDYNYPQRWLKQRYRTTTKGLLKLTVLPLIGSNKQNVTRSLTPARLNLSQTKSSTLYDITDLLSPSDFKNRTGRKVTKCISSTTTSRPIRTISTYPINFNKFQVGLLYSHLQPTFTLLGKQTLNVVDYLCIKPLDSVKFRRSDFFFVHLMVRLLPIQIDLISTSPVSSTDFDCNVFPDANLVKVEAFRRLNKQKNLFRTRHSTFNTLLINNPRKVNRGTPNLYLNSSSASFFDTQVTSLARLRRISSPYLNLKYLFRSKYRAVRIPRVRFKPGYGRIWRKARSSIRELANLPVRYQYRLTPKLHWLYLQDRKLLKSYSYASLDYVLLSSHLIPDFWSLKELLNNKALFLNGLLVYNPNLKLFVNDFIQIVINLRFYITLKWLRVWSETRQNRVSRIFYSKYRPSATNRNQRFVRRLPSWFFDLKFTYRSIPQITEVDFFTLSVFVIHDKQAWDLTEPLRANLYDASSLNMYNWKYIT